MNDGVFDSSAFFNAMSMEFASRKGHLKHADAVILPPFDANDHGQRTYHAALFNAAFVAKMLDPRYQDVPLIILNHNDCYDALIKSHLAYAQGGFSKEFGRAAIHNGPVLQRCVEGQKGVHHRALHYANILSGDNEANLFTAAQRMLDAHFANYHRAEIHKLPKQEGGIAKPAGLHTFTLYGSASSSNLAITKDAVMAANIAARMGSGLVTGGGDQYVMGAFNEGYVAPVKGPWLSGISTHGIVRIENATGHIPKQCDHWVLVHDIGDRLAMLVESGDTHVALGGGNGTGQEGNVFAALKYFMPDYMQPKTMIFIGDSAAKRAELKAIVGYTDFCAMRKDGDALAHKGLFYRPHTADAEPLMRNLAATFNRNFAAKRLIAA